MQLPWKSLVAAAGVLILFGVAVWFFFLRDTQSVVPVATPQSSNFTSGAVVTTSTTLPDENTSSTEGSFGYTGTQKVFKIADGPVAAATFIQTFNPTTTVARYVQQSNGHVFDMPVEVPGSMPRAISNTTIPGIANALWGEGGNSLILQYQEERLVKTLYLGLPPRATSTPGSLIAPKIRFLPDNITSVALSPDTKQVAYLLTTANGSSGYVANIDGTASRLLFSLPLAQVRLTWPAQGTLLAQTKAATGVPGIAFSIAAQSGTVTPLLHAPGLSAIADAAFAKIVYQNATLAGKKTYAHDVVSGGDIQLSFNPIPEKCIWGTSAASLLYCALPLSYTEPNYLDAWYRGLASAADSLLAINIATGARIIIATPGLNGGGKQSDIISLSVAPKDDYLSFVVKGDRSLWGARLVQ